MAYKKIEMGTKKHIKRLHSSGISIHEIARQMNISRNTVRSIIRNDLPSLEGSTLTDTNQTRYDQFREWLPYIESELYRKGVTRQLLWLEYKDKMPEGYSYSQFCYHLQEYLKPNEVTLHIDQKPADKLYVDFTGHKLQIVDRKTGEISEKEVFVATLGYSGFTYVEACDSQRKEDYISCLENALRYLGGVPAVIVPDNLKSAVTKADNYEPLLNKNLAEFGEHHEVAILPARSRKPRDKAWVERMVGIVYSHIFAPLRNEVFDDQFILNEEIWLKLETLNSRPLQKRPESRSELFEKDEKPLLKPLNPDRYQIREYAQATLMKNSYVYLKCDKHYYSAPYQYIGKKLKINYTRDYVSIFYNHQQIAFHQRDKRPYKYTTVAAHLPSTHQVVLDWSPESFLLQAEKISESVKGYIQRILNKAYYPEQAYRSCRGIFNLGKKYGNERLVKACQRAESYGNYSYMTIKKILINNYDKLPMNNQQEQKQIPFHDNIRGANYYK